MHPTVLAATRHFPLIGRPRPICLGIGLRLQEVRDAVAAAQEEPDNCMHDAAHALNKAALIASDGHMADLARQLCWQHINAYREAGRPLTFLECRYMLEPVHNLARLKIRADHGTPALALLEDMHQAVKHRQQLTVEGQTLPTSNLTGELREEESLRRWVWLQLIGDGVRVLVLAHRWPEAAAHARRHNGIGDHPLEGRQAAIIAHLVQNEAAQAAQRLAQTVITEPWEHDIMPCLEAMYAIAQDDEKAAIQHLETALVRLHIPEQDPQHGSYRARLGLTVATLAQEVHPNLAAKVRTEVIEEARNSHDGYAARDVLNCRALASTVTRHQRDELARVALRSGLGQGALTPRTIDELVGASTTAAQMLRAAMSMNAFSAR
jgi:hypothetical protein